MMVAAPVGLFAAIYLSEYADSRLRSWAKPLLEILAGVPTVVYGFFALLTVGPLLRDFALFLGYEDAVTQSALSAGLVMPTQRRWRRSRARLKSSGIRPT